MVNFALEGPRTGSPSIAILIGSSSKFSGAAVFIAAWLLVFRATMNRPSGFWSWLNRRAYAVYILHPPVLVALGLLLHPWSAPALVKFATTGTLTCIATWLVADVAVRMPGVRHVI